MYTEETANVKLHCGGSGKACQSLARDSILNVCFWFFGFAKYDAKYSNWYKDVFGKNCPIGRTTSDGEYGKWLLSVDKYSTVYNYMVVIARLYEHIKNK